MNQPASLMTEAVACLDEIQALAPDAALVRLAALRASHPSTRIELGWEEEWDGRPHYQLFLGNRGERSLVLAVEPPASAPFVMRGAQRWMQAQLVAIGGRRVYVHDAMMAIDALWSEVGLLDRLVEHYLVRDELERTPIELDDERIQRAVDRFRSERGLGDPDRAAQWLRDHGMALADLEDTLAHREVERELRRRVVGAEVDGLFARDPAAWDTIDLVALPVDDRSTADRCLAQLAAGTPWIDVVERTLAARRDGGRAARSMSYETLRRREVATDDPAALREGGFAMAQLLGRGPYVVAVRSITAAVLDDATREAIEIDRFAAWLRTRRAETSVVWNWGPRDPESDEHA